MNNLLIRYTGSNPSVQEFSIPQITGRYKFGNTSLYFQNLINPADWPLLRYKYGRQLISVPIELIDHPMALGTSIQSSTILTASEKQILLMRGFKTLGEVIAEDEQIIIGLLGDDNAIVRIRELFGFDTSTYPE